MGKTRNSPGEGAKNILMSIDKVNHSWIPDETIVHKNRSNISNFKIARDEISKENALAAISKATATILLM